MPQRPLFNALAWAGTLGLVLFGFGTARGPAATPGPAFRVTPARAQTVASLLAKPHFRILQPSLLELDERAPDRPLPNNLPTRSAVVPYDQRPVDDSVPVFIPHGVAAPVPDALPGHSVDVTLTFDDCGSATQIQAVVDALAAVHRKALFFITGQCRDHFPWLVGTLLAGGHQVCNHTYSHPDLRRLSDAAIRSEIARGVMVGCPYFRPPYGAWDGPRGRIARVAAEFGLRPMLWDVDSRDWAGAPADRIAAVARSRGGIVLFHLHGANTAEAVRLLG